MLIGSGPIYFCGESDNDSVIDNSANNKLINACWFQLFSIPSEYTDYNFFSAVPLRYSEIYIELENCDYCILRYISERKKIFLKQNQNK